MPNFQTIPNTIDVVLYGKIEQLTPTLSKGRVRTFYKGLNRNRTFISEDFAQQLVDSLPYAPVKGIFDKDEEDFTDHGKDNTDGRIYGVVMADPNFAWEDHLDDDGVVRSYACADVILFTGLYPEASLIEGKSQSMEIFRDNLVGEWKIWEDGEPYYEFIKGCLVGLQVLGDMTEPCFEGAAFFNLYKDIKEMSDYIKFFSKKEKEDVKMDKTLFRLSDSEKTRALEQLLNPNFCEEGNWVQERVVLDTYDDYALCFNIEKNSYERAYYSKDGDNVVLGDVVDVYIVDVTGEEKLALEAMKAMNGTYEASKAALDEKATLEAEKVNYESEKTALEEKIADYEAQAEAQSQEKTEYETKVSEYEQAVSDFTSKISALESEKVEMEQKLLDITNENATLSDFKRKTENEKKLSILTKYEEYLSESVYDKLKDSVDTFSVDDFKKEVCTAAVESSPAIFNKQEEAPLIYKGRDLEDDKVYTRGAERLLNKWKNGGNK